MISIIYLKSNMTVKTPELEPLTECSSLVNDKTRSKFVGFSLVYFTASSLANKEGGWPDLNLIISSIGFYNRILLSRDRIVNMNRRINFKFKTNV